MAESPAYAILGRGRWAARMRTILEKERRSTASIDDVRQLPDESDERYKSRLSSALAATGAHIAWFCIAPGPHIPLMVEAALCAGLHVVVEKPWLCSRADTQILLALARAKKLLIAIHYQYCLLEEVEKWRQAFAGKENLRFGGQFKKLASDERFGVTPLENFGSHLMSIRAYAVPRASTSEIDCAYRSPEQRCVWLETRNRRVATIDFLANREPTIQRFIAKIEAAIEGATFPFDLDFALHVADSLTALRTSEK